ncbi:MAG: hypothetical protein ACI8R4_003204 [Paracoccaceae bacterium]
MAEKTSDLTALRDQLRMVVQEHMALDPAHDLAHLDRVWRNAQAITVADRKGDLQVLLAASYLHDLVNLPKDHPNRALASAQSADAAGPILAGLGFTPDQIKNTQHAITAHSYSAGIPPETPEAMILRDADRLDALGAIGIARTFVVAGALGLPLYDPNDPHAQQRPLDDNRFAIDHWQVKLLKLPDGMLTPTGCDMAQQRVRVMLDYLATLSAELGTEMPANLMEPSL